MHSITRASLGALALTVVSSPAFALTPVSACDVGDLTPTAQACAGYYAGNLLSGNAQDLLDQQTALASIGLNWDTGDWSTVDATKDNDGDAFGEFTNMSGLTWVAIHYGAGNAGPGKGVRGGVTAFYRFDAGQSLASFGINEGAISSITLYQTGGDVVPEPATWAMMIAGFGLVGAAARRRTVGTLARTTA